MQSALRGKEERHRADKVSTSRMPLECERSLPYNEVSRANATQEVPRDSRPQKKVAEGGKTPIIRKLEANQTREGKHGCGESSLGGWKL